MVQQQCKKEEEKLKTEKSGNFDPNIYQLLYFGFGNCPDITIYLSDIDLKMTTSNSSQSEFSIICDVFFGF